MKRTIWKSEIPVTESFELKLPMAAKILCVQVQSNKPCIWVLVMPGNTDVVRRFRVFSTGAPYDIANTNRYVGTFQLNNGAFVGHLFEVTH